MAFNEGMAILETADGGGIELLKNSNEKRGREDDTENPTTATKKVTIHLSDSKDEKMEEAANEKDEEWKQDDTPTITMSDEDDDDAEKSMEDDHDGNDSEDAEKKAESNKATRAQIQ